MMNGNNNAFVRFDLKSTSKTELSNILGLNLKNWWSDPDFITKTWLGHDVFTIRPGDYRITVRTDLEYLQFQPLNGDRLATLQRNGSGTIWVIGNGIGKPHLTNNVGWNPNNALPMAPAGRKKYQITLTAGETIHATNIGFKFFYQPDFWGGEFTDTTLTSNSPLIAIGNTKEQGYGDLSLRQPLQDKATYVFTIDLDNGLDNAILDVRQL
jgi:hypothetical protein